MHQMHLWCDVIALWKVHAQRPETKKGRGQWKPKALTATDVEAEV